MNLRLQSTTLLFLAAAFALGCSRNSDEVQGPTGTLKGKVMLAGAASLPAPASSCSMRRPVGFTWR